MSVVPLIGSARGSALQDASVAVFIRDLRPACGPEAASLSAFFGLTPAEARLAAALGAGATLAQAAAGLQISVHTARTQLGEVLAKTEVHRQTDLVSMLTGLASPALEQR